jgi:hypothetical protein
MLQAGAINWAVMLAAAHRRGRETQVKMSLLSVLPAEFSCGGAGDRYNSHRPQQSPQLTRSP